MKRAFLYIGIFLCLFLGGVGALYLFVEYQTPEEVSVSPLGEWIRKPEIIGFQPYWLVKNGKQDYSDELTTLAYFSLRMEQDGTIRKFENPGEAEPGWRMLQSDTYAATLSAHRKKNVKLSLLVQNMVEEEILEFIKEPETTAKTLIREVGPIMKQHGFTDLNLDIESFNKASDSARLGYTSFVRAVKEEMKKETLGTLTVELTPKSPIEKHLIDVSAITEIADYVVLMAYDYHYVFSSSAGPVAPVGGVPDTAEYDVETALKETLRYAPPTKVILGIPLYGYEWETLTTSPGAAVIPGSWQVATGSRVIPQAETCTDCTKQFDSISQEPYLIFPGEREGHFQQAFYENKEALQAKINLAKKYELAGVAMWAIGYEPEGMLDPLSMYKKSVQYRGFNPTPTPDYKSIPPATFTMLPPTTALVGSISTQSGEALKRGRTDEQYQALPFKSPVVSGESYATGSDGVIAIHFPQVSDISLSGGSEISLGLLSPNTPFFRVRNGTVTVRQLHDDHPWSIRVLHALVQLNSGEIVIGVEGDGATVRVVDGAVTIGAIDQDNETYVYTAKTGDRVDIDQSSKTISFR